MRAVAAPMPDAAPEMMATLPASLIVVLPSLSGAVRGIVNAAGRFSTSSPVELSTIYSNLGKAVDFTDISQGSCRPI
jgi:hypothetical protein